MACDNGNSAPGLRGEMFLLNFVRGKQPTIRVEAQQLSFILPPMRMEIRSIVDFRLFLWLPRDRQAF
jgi:hypothetical protein